MDSQDVLVSSGSGAPALPAGYFSYSADTIGRHIGQYIDRYSAAILTDCRSIVSMDMSIDNSLTFHRNSTDAHVTELY